MSSWCGFGTSFTLLAAGVITKQVFARTFTPLRTCGGKYAKIASPAFIFLPMCDSYCTCSNERLHEVYSSSIMGSRSVIHAGYYVISLRIINELSASDTEQHRAEGRDGFTIFQMVGAWLKLGINGWRIHAVLTRERNRETIRFSCKPEENFYIYRIFLWLYGNWICFCGILWPERRVQVSFNR